MRLGQSSEPFRGNANVRWDQSDWFTSLLTLESKSGGSLNLEYRGRVPVAAERYTFVLQHSELGRVEGEGWVTPQAIMQRFWVLNDPQKRTGVESFVQATPDRYCYACGVVSGLRLVSSIEGIFERT